MSTTTVYARVPTQLKSRVDSQAEKWDMTLAKTVAVLLSIGIEHAELVCPACGRKKHEVGD
jgi:hypothetical protein